MIPRTLLSLATAALLAAPALSQEKNEAKPLLRLEAGGPTSNVTSLAFSPDGKTLYVAGFDKVVRTWKLKNGKFELDDATSFRVPIGPGLDGAINAIAVSDDGKYLAVGGFGVVAEGMKFTEAGRLIPVKGGLTPSLRADRGQILVFNTRDRSVKTLRGHSGPVIALAFDRTPNGGAGVDFEQRLISAAEGWDAGNSRDIGEVKIWNVEQAKETAGRTMPSLLEGYSRRPGLGLVGRQAFLAWVDGNLTTWQAGDANVTTAPAAKFNTSLDVNVDGRLRVLTAGMVGANGTLVESPGSPNARQFAFPRQGLGQTEFDMPDAARYVGDKHVAVALRRMKDGLPTSLSLAIVDANAQGFDKQVASIPLGPTNAILPTLAASPTHVAVGGFPDHRVLIFSVADMVTGKTTPRVLHSVGATMRSVAFVKKGNERGLTLNEKTGKGDVVFSIDGGKLDTAPAGWADDSAAANDYRLSVNDRTATLSKGAAEVTSATIKEGAITATAVLPPGANESPLFAIASYLPKKGTTLLELYDGKTGQMVRRFVGHTAPIRSLSFRADGKLLASAADDQTTIVWSLTDLGDIVGKYGAFADLAVEQRGKDLAVIDAAGIAGVNNGDLIRGLYDKAGKLEPLTSPAAFYEAIWMKKPNQNVKLKITRGGADQDVQVAVKQGVDVRKPLFTLFFPRGQGGKLGDWLGWNAIGPYDSSRKDVEQYLGWHFNTGKADQPTSFAFIDQYRKEYFRPGVLKEMADLGDLPPPPKPPLPKPAVLAPGVEVDGKLLTAVGGEYLLRGKSFDLNVTIPAYEPIDGDVLTYQLGKGPIVPMEQSNVNQWSAKVDVDRQGKDPTRQVVIRMKRTPPGWPAQEFRSDVTFRLASPPPKIALELPKSAGPFTVDQETFPVRAKVTPGEPGVEFVLRYGHLHLGENKGGFSTARDVEIAPEQPVKLEPGLNLIIVHAKNVRATHTTLEDGESARETIKVYYEPKKIAPPKFEFVNLPNEVGGDLPFSVARFEKSQVDLKYEIKSEEPITQLEWTTDLAPNERHRLDPASKDRNINLKLKPGFQAIKVYFKTAKSAEMSFQQGLEFRPPPLPKPAIVNLEDGFTISKDGDEFKTPLEVRFTPVEGSEARSIRVEASVFSNGRRTDKTEVRVDSAAGTVSFPGLLLTPGDSEIRVTFRDDIGSDDQVASVRGRFVQPPRVTNLVGGVFGKAPFADLKANVVSSIPPSAEFVAVTVNGKAVRPRSIDVKRGDDPRSWIIDLAGAPLEAIKGKDVKNDITVSLMTSEGEAKASLQQPIVFSLPLPPAPEIALLEPALREATLSEPVMKLRFKVQSDAPLTRVDVMRGDKLFKKWEAIPVTADGVYEFTLTDVPLDWGVTGLGLSAWNEGGVRMTALNVNVPAQPVRLDLESAELAPAGLKIKPGVDGGFAPLPTGRVMLNGKVRWNSNEDARLQKAKQVRMFVNGFQQLPVDMKPVPEKERERSFQVPVVLNFADNTVEVDLPELKQDAANRRKIPISCLQPVRGQHLHVLVIAPQEKDETKLVESLTRGIKATPIGGNLYKTPVFDVVRFYVLARHVQLLEISSRLDRIAENLKERARAGNPNDLVMIYFQGKETVDSTGPILWTSESAPWLQLTLKDLSKNYLSRFSGGQVLILDTISKAGDIDFRDVRFAYMRRPDPRPLADASRPRLSAELEKEMPQIVWLDQLTSVLAAQVRPTFQSFLPEPLRNKIQLNSN